MKFHHHSIIFTLFFSIFFQLNAQESQSAKMMFYNLLYYGSSALDCNEQNNSRTAKDGYLRTLVNYTNADIYAFCEISNNARWLDTLQVNVFDGVSKSFSHANFQNRGLLSNALFYNNALFGLADQTTITQNRNGTNIVRAINFYRLYYKDPALENGADTTFLAILVGHLKAGNFPSDQEQRRDATNAVMDFLNSRNKNENLIICGDFNLYTSNEPAYQNLLTHPNSSIAFFDPIATPGDWDRNSNFAAVHTQSTHTQGGGCPSGGGMDSRFDFILVNNNVLNGNLNVKYVADSYEALGQDGIRYRSTITSPANTAVPQGMANVLFNMSDHLPILANFEFENKRPNSVSEVSENYPTIKAFFSDGSLQINSLDYQGQLFINIFNLSGQKLIENKKMTINASQDFNWLPQGVYFIQMITKDGHFHIEKAIKI